MKTILLVEDDDILRSITAVLLKLADYNILTATNGKEGIEITQKEQPDLIICDVTMPVIDGFGMLHILRGNPVTASIPFIFLTAKIEKSDFRNAMLSGADDYITKPYGTNDLLKAIEIRLRKQDELAAKFQHHSQSSIKPILPENDVTIEALIKNCKKNVYHNKQIIFKEGQTSHYLYYILKGKVKKYKVHKEDDKEFVIGLYKEGDFFGHIALLRNLPYDEMASAIEETELALIPAKEFENLVHNNLSIANNLLNILAKNILEHEKHLVDIAYDTLRQKVAFALITLKEKFHNNNSELFSINMPREELASIAGTAKESLVRTLGEFKDEKLIDVKDDYRIEIIDSEKLKNLLK